MSLGDSKTQVAAWQDTLLVGITAATGLVWTKGDGGVPGSTVASYAATVVARLATFNPPNPPNVRVLCNWGANDAGGLTAGDETAWKANYNAILDAVLAKWPNALVYLTRPWTRGRATECNLMASWVSDLVAARPGAVFLGDDERVWLEGGDNGATNTFDGTHYTAAGQLAARTAKQTAMGY